MAVASKVVVVHRGATTRKYGSSGWTAIAAALRTLISADSVRGLSTKVLAMDVAADARGVGAAPCSAAVTPTAAAVKLFVDAVTARLAPDYVLMLGSIDLLPQAELDNPLWTGNPQDDPDSVIPSDLPYACDGALVRTISAYRGPTRVVSRLPDLVGATTPAYLLGLLQNAATWTSQTSLPPLPVFAVSAATWRRSTATSIALLGGAQGVVHTSPSNGPSWPAAALDAPLVFVNCHGGQNDPSWYGEKFSGQVALPHALDAGRLLGVVRRGTTVAAECCYGTMHWSPSSAGGQAGVAGTWLAQGASALFGSSTAAYGPATGNADADVITRMFLEAVAGGASVGRAALVARQRYVQSAGSLGPTELKTLGQFELWGDPSIHPIAAPPASPQPKLAARRGVARGTPGRVAAGATDRRAALAAVGRALQTTVPAVGPARRRAALTRSRFAAVSGVDVGMSAIRTFDAISPPGGAAAQAVFHVAFTGRPGRRSIVLVRARRGAPPETIRLETK